MAGLGATPRNHGGVSITRSTEIETDSPDQIWSLPKLALVFSTDAIATLQNVLGDSMDAPTLSLPQDPPRKPQDLDVDQILVAPLGESSPRPHLFVSRSC